ncbi:MAG: DUF58 domain-containing protein [Bacteriovorax sp.]|nr:DUF58 domain-containing protein [Bacteriovorax sp.]
MALNMILLIMGLIYANNYVLLFNFVLFCLFLGSMFYTHFNLNGLKLTSTQFPSLHANEYGTLSLHFTTHNAQGNYFIRPYFKSSLLAINDEKETFPVTFAENSNVNISIRGLRRGHESIQSIYVESLFPFNFFRCFTFFRVDLECFVYPERENLQLHEEVEVVETDKSEGDDFYLRDYQNGDSLKRVDWKKLAQTNRWYTRQFQSVKPSPVMLIYKQKAKEETLKSLCYALHVFHQQDIKYGLQLGKEILIAPENSPRHLSHCLQELACYEA